MKDQIIKQQIDAEYREVDRFSKHESDDFTKNPYAYFKRKSAGIKHEPTEAMRLGSAVHAAILQPDLFRAAYTMQPESIKVRRGKEWDAFAIENAGKEILKAGDYANCLGMAESVLAHSVGGTILKNCSADNREVSMFATIAGVPVKSRADIITDDYSLLCDVKTTADASPDAFMKQASDLAYDVQAAWYLMAAEALGMKPSGFAFLAVEKEFPWTVGCYTFTRNSEFVRAGEQEVLKRLREYTRWQDGTLEHPAGWIEYDLKLPPWNKRLQALHNPQPFNTF